MAKTLSFTDTSPRTVKIGDTTTSFTLICGNDNVATDLTNVTSITVRLGNDSGYLKSATVDPTSLTDPTTGQVTVTFNADLMTSLIAGSYAIEVWVVDSTGTSIYPSDGSTGFNITNNIQSTNGSTITTITFDDFVNEFKTIAANALPGTTDTTNFQKRKITNDDGSFNLSIPNATGVDVTNKLLSLSSGLYTCYIQVGAKNNPSNDSLRGLVWISAGYGGGIFGTNSTGGHSSYRLFIEGTSLTWKKLAAQTSGTLDVTSAFYKSGTTSSTGALNYVLTGNVLHVSGTVSPSANLAAGSTPVLFNLPSSIGTIAENVSVIQQSYGWNTYCLLWNPNGAVAVWKHNAAGTATAIPTTAVLQVSADILLK